MNWPPPLPQMVLFAFTVVSSLGYKMNQIVFIIATKTTN